MVEAGRAMSTWGSTVARIVLGGSLACDATPGQAEPWPQNASTPQSPARLGLANLELVTQDSPDVGACRGWTHNDPCAPRQQTAGAPSLSLKPLSIRGDDGRLDLHCLLQPRANQAEAPGILRQSDKVAAMFVAGDLVLGADGLYRPHPKFPTLAHLPDNDALCDDEVFAHQPRGAWCGSVLVADRTILMAEHCVHKFEKKYGTKYEDMRLVFDFAIPADGGPLAVAPLSVCKVAADPRKTVVSDDLTLMDIDCAEGFAREPATIAVAMPTAGLVYAVGFPMRLPAKFSGWAKLQPVDGRSFQAGLDVFPGNSGSPVFAGDHTLVGLLEDDQSRDTCEDPVRRCQHWNSIPSNSHELVLINSTHELIAELARRKTERK